ncbi:MAG: hypothetical protein LBP26_00045 [Clostridiales bacterium]|jgi:hypothetical protein|nr:hypothetical protein [Clostridiales bacterium]
MSEFAELELNEAKRQIGSMLRKLEKCVPKLRDGTAQRALAVRRVEALKISLALIERDLNGYLKESV